MMPTEALGKRRSWVSLFAVVMFLYAVVGGAIGMVWLVDLITRFAAGPPPTRPFITVSSIHLLFAPIALVGGVLAIGFFRAASRARSRRDAGDVARASVALRRLWRWGGVTIAVLIVFSAAMVAAAVVTGEWPG